MKQKLQQNNIRTPIGVIQITLSDYCLEKIEYSCADAISKKPSSKLAINIANQLKQYFSDPKYKFELPLNLQGTEFEKRVWNELRKIPSGKTKTYGELAIKLDTSPRAIGNACRKNPFPIIIPCHRVVAKNNIGGYCGNSHRSVLAKKSWLLKHERQFRAVGEFNTQR